MYLKNNTLTPYPECSVADVRNKKWHKAETLTFFSRKSAYTDKTSTDPHEAGETENTDTYPQPNEFIDVATGILSSRNFYLRMDSKYKK